jgi:hypothetical protein
MTIVNVKVSGNKMVSSIDGLGKEELQKVLDKMKDGLIWHLDIYSDATLKSEKILDEEQ